uniref:Uncharacterized protein n=1 Tax=Micrurus lemniscatus lemniscatus TaxID=129467 RepID=A0A2D4IBZ5_MICLE
MAETPVSVLEKQNERRNGEQCLRHHLHCSLWNLYCLRYIRLKHCRKPVKEKKQIDRGSRVAVTVRRWLTKMCHATKLSCFLFLFSKKRKKKRKGYFKPK